MKKVTIRGINLGRICLGTANFGYGVSEKDAFRLIDIFRDYGGNLLDTANVYCRWIDGENGSEKLLGRYLKERGRHSVYIATKGGHYDFSEPSKSRVAEKEVRKDIESSLCALGKESIDFYWLHRDNLAIPVEEILYFCEKLKKEGKIVNYGASNFCTERMIEAQKISEEKGYSGFFGLSDSFSCAVENFDPSADKTLAKTDKYQLRWLNESGTFLFAYSAGARGFFAKKFRDGENFDKRSYAMYDNKENERRFEILKEASHITESSISACGLAALLALPINIIPVFSASCEEHLYDNLKGEEITLDENIVKKLNLMGK